MASKYYIDVRYKSGVREKVYVSKTCFEQFASWDYPLGCPYHFGETPQNTRFVLDQESIARFSLCIEKTNPLEDIDHYEDPLN